MSAGAPTCECPPGTRCIPCTTGTLEVTVYLQTVCWDTDRTLGLDSPDRPFSGVNVTVMDGSTTVGSKMTDGSGIAVFDALDAGEVGGSGKDYTFTVSKDGFDDKTDDVFFSDLATRDLTSNSVHIDVHKTTHAIRVLRRVMKTGTKPGLECTRKHSAPTPSSFAGTTLGPILWQGEPGLLVMRDLLWLAAGAGALVAGLVGFLAAPPGSPFLPGVIAIAGICLAFFGYFAGVIFGITFGAIAIVAAFAAFLALTVLTIISMAAPSFLHLPPPDPWGFPILAGTWAGFGYGWIPQRRSAYNNEGWECRIHLLIALLLGAATAAALCLLLLGPNHTDLKDAGRVVAFILVILGGAVFGLVAGLLGYCFVNEGRTKFEFKLGGFLLPFAGQRYCVQGHRGFISHYSRHVNRGWPYDEEPSYDWSMPEGTRLLCVKEGHVVAYNDEKDGTQFGSGNSDANYIAVRHFDGTAAKYLHLMKDGITGADWNARISEAVTVTCMENEYVPTAATPNPLHVHAGQVVGANGNVGISMFPHLHLYVMKPTLPEKGGREAPNDPPNDSWFQAFTFDDPDTQSHGGRCWSMRKYTSSNVDKGLLVIADNYPPFKPGGSATNGDPVPGSPLAGSSSGSSSGGSGPTPPTPTPPTPGAPPLPGTSGTPPSTPPPGTPPVPPGP